MEEISCWSISSNFLWNRKKHYDTPFHPSHPTQTQRNCYDSYTFHFHDSIVRNILALSLLLRLHSGLIVLLRGNYNHGLTNHALERAHFAFLSVRVNVRLEWEGEMKKREINKHEIST